MTIMAWVERFIRWRRRRFWEQSSATNTLHNAWTHLYASYYSCASSQSRGFILPETQEALDILHIKARESLEHSLEL